MVLVVLSGGMDSATLLAKAVAEFGKENVSALTFNYGSKHNAQENRCAKKLAAFYEVNHTMVALDFIGELFKSDLLKSGGEVPEGHYEEENMKKTVVPFRNGIMLSIAAGYAESIGASIVLIGSHAGDHAIYPDCREGFMTHMANAISNGTWCNIALFRPFENFTKGKIVKLGVKLGVPYHLTWTCYKGQERHCGRCGSCTERLDAFDYAGAIDPVAYEDRTTYKEVLARGPNRE